MIHPKPGRPNKYHQNGRKPTPPTGGWHSEAVDTPHAREAIALIESGAISRTDKPWIVWNRYAQLQVVSPNIFARFLKKCFTRANFEPDSPESQDSLDEPASPSSEMSRFSERTPPRHSRTSDPPLTICDSLSTPQPVDAPTNNDGPRNPRNLRSIDEMNRKNQSVAMETEIIEMEDRGYLIIQGRPMGTSAGDYSWRRDKLNTRRGEVAWPRNPLLRNEKTLHSALTRGRQGALVVGESVMVHDEDPFLNAMMRHIKKRNGATAEEVSVNLL